MRRWLLGCFAWWMVLPVATGVLAQPAPAVPEPLTEWRDWVLHGHEQARCPLLLGRDPAAADARACAWPGQLQLQADADGARFSIEWTVLADAAIALPGDAQRRPLDVQVDGRDAAVVIRDDRPSVQLAPGRHRIAGRFAWSERPERLPLPAAIGLIALDVDGAAVAQPQRDDRHLWLGRSASTEAVTRDSLSLRVYRLLADGVPMMLASDLQLEVAGRARELVLERPLPDGFVATALDSPLPASLDADGRLRVQLRPGSWRLRLQARATGVADVFAAPAADPPWPREEIWSFRAAPQLRSVQPVGQRPVDPQQVATPWNEPLPSFVLDADAPLTIEQRSRGLDPARPHRLQLDRTLWLDFADGGITALDRIRGELAAPGRLDLQAPWQLQHAEAGDEPLLLTAASDGAVGIELRERAVDLRTLARRTDLAGALGSGWNTAFESMTLALQLPPGWRLLHAGGAGDAAAAYTARWTLLDLFLLALATLLGYRLFGVPFAALVAGYLLLGYHEAEPPLWTLLGAMLAMLLWRMLPSGRLARAVGAVRMLLLLLAVLWALPFAATQLKLALYPQLECREVALGYDSDCDREAMLLAEQAVLDSITVSGTRLKPSDALMEDAAPMSVAAPPPAPPAPPMRSRIVADAAAPPPALDRYPSDAIVQAGPGTPDWHWRRVAIDIDGPVTAEQRVTLWLAPPWLGSLWRLACVALLGLLLLRLAGTAFKRPTPAAAPALLAWLALAVVPLPADAADAFPPPELLEQLRQRLLEAPRCAPQCAAVEQAALRLDGQRLRLQLELHVQADSALPLPAAGRTATLRGVRLDGNPAELLRHDGGDWLRVSRGVHLAELEWQAGADTIDLRFPLPPARLDVSAADREIAGLHDGQLLGDTLQLLPQAASTAADGRVAAAGSEFTPFVQLTRRIELGLDWSVTTTAQRIAPQQGGFSLRVPLLDGENVQDATLRVDDQHVTLAFAAGQSAISWRSTLPVTPSIALPAGSLARTSERWQVQVGPLWHLEHAGVPEISGHGDGALQFQPLPDETLQLMISRPPAIDGAAVAIDRARLVWTPGERAADAVLELTVRSTRGGPHALILPGDAELIDVRRDHEALALRLVDGVLTLPLLPGEQEFAIRWRQPVDDLTWLRSPAIDLGSDAANMQIELDVPTGRWLLATFGAGIGPAVLYWPLLLLATLLAWALARFAPTPLRLHQWWLLALGFSALSWIAALLVTGWLLLLGLRERHASRLTQWPRTGFALVQLGLVAATLLALLCLVAVIPYGLLGDPDMQVVGNGSNAGQLQWFVDRSRGALPQVAVLSLPLWLYKLALLAWALWLANALIGWLRWGWRSFSTGGYWPRRHAALVSSDAAPAAPTDG